MPGRRASRSHLPLIVMPQRCSVLCCIGIGDQDRGPFKKRCTGISRASFFRPFFDSMSNIRFWPIVTLAPFRVELDRETEQVNPKALDKTKSLVNFFRSRSTFRVFFKKQSTAVTRAEKGVPLRPTSREETENFDLRHPSSAWIAERPPPASPTPSVVRPRPARRPFYGPDVPAAPRVSLTTGCHAGSRRHCCRRP